MPARLLSLDALRGFDMFWIVGAEGLVMALEQMGHNGVVKFLAQQLTHKDWAGFAFYDLIFPLFVFMMGVSTVFSLSKTLQREGRSAAVGRAVRRFALLFLLGIFYYGGFANEWPKIRLLGVLQRIALAYLFAGLLFCFFDWKAMAGIAAGLLLGYWALLTFIPIRDIQLDGEALQKLSGQAGTTNTAALFYGTTRYVTGGYEPGKNLANHLDFQYLPGRKHDVYYDPEGLLSTLPAVATALLGVFCGMLLQSGRVSDQQKVVRLLVAGVLSVVMGFLWGLQFPVVKKLWSSSFVLVAGGYSMLLLAVFYQLVDVWKYQTWCQPFVWIGMNPITIYMAENVLSMDRMAERFAGGSLKRYLNTHLARGTGDLLVAIISLGITFLICRFLYKRKLFLRV